MSRVKQRGRPRKVSRTNPVAVIERIVRPMAPPEFTEAQQAVWREIVDSQPADWFTPASLPLLAQYCRHTCHAGELGQQLRDLHPDQQKVRAKLLTLQKQESAAMIALARSLRLSQQSVKDHYGHKIEALAQRKPWH